VKAWLTRESESYWTLSRQRPIVARMEGTSEDRIYPRPGDGLWYRFLCRYAASAMHPQADQMAINESRPIHLTIQGQARQA
jgi:hypothetical protein